MRAPQSHNFCFTDYGLKTELYNKLIDDGYLTYIAWGLETCPNTQRLHHQAWCHTKKKATERAVAKALGKCHTEIIRGTLLSNDVYCSKQATLNELGVRPQQGLRNIAEMATAIREGSTTVDEILAEDPMAFHQYGRTLLAVSDSVALGQRRSEMTKGVWLYGATGVGKTHKAYELAKEVSEIEPYMYTDDRGWWDTYAGQPVVIVDDFRGSIPYGQLLRLVDKWQTSVSRRGRPPMPFTSKMVIITSSLSPEGVYNNLAQEDSLAQLHRRFEVKQL